MLVAAAVLPHPPLLVPELAAGAAGELDVLRTACTKAIDAALAASPDRVVVVAAGPARASFGPGSRGSLAGFGVPVEVSVPGAPASGEPVLPLAATIGCWLLTDMDVAVPASVEVVPADTTPDGAAAIGAALTASDERLALIAMGGGSAALTQKAPGYLVDGADAWQAEVERALGTADLDHIAALTAADAERYRAAGRPAWQVLAGAARAGRWRAELLAAEAPYGVGYVVAAWRPA